MATTTTTKTEIKKKLSSAQKRVLQGKVRTLRNRIVKTKVKNRRKKVLAALNTGNVVDAKTALNELYTSADRAAKKGTIHPNTVARIKSRLTLALNKKQAAAVA